MNTKHRWEMKIIIEVLASTVIEASSLWTWKTFTGSSETESRLRHANLNTRHRYDADSDGYLTPVQNEHQSIFINISIQCESSCRCHLRLFTDPGAVGVHAMCLRYIE